MKERSGFEFQILKLHLVVVYWISQHEVQRRLDASEGGKSLGLEDKINPLERASAVVKSTTCYRPERSWQTIKVNDGGEIKSLYSSQVKHSQEVRCFEVPSIT